MKTISRLFAAVIIIGLFVSSNIQAASQTTFYHHDALGSIIATSNENGFLQLTEEYQPYGEKIYQTEDLSSGNEDWYTGKNYNKELDLTYFGARWYDAKQGRFLSIDPVPVSLTSIHSFNRYHYANSNPYRYVDPDGEAPSDVTKRLFQIKSGPVRHRPIPVHEIGIGPRLASESGMGGAGRIGSNQGLKASSVIKETKFYRYVSEGEAQAIRRSGKIPNVDAAGNPKDVYITNRLYETAGRAKTHNQLPSKPSYRVEINPANVPSRTPFRRVNPGDNPQWGIGGGVEAKTKNAISVDPGTLTRLKGG